VNARKKPSKRGVRLSVCFGGTVPVDQAEILRMGEECHWFQGKALRREPGHDCRLGLGAYRKQRAVLRVAADAFYHP
jgi:hypothetical protein